MSEANFAQTMIAHKSALVYPTVYTYDAPLACILPHGNIAPVSQFRFLWRIHRYHNLVVVYLSLQVFIIEIAPRIEQGHLSVSLLYHAQKSKQRVAEGLRR